VRSALMMATVAVLVAIAGTATGAFRPPADATGWAGICLLSMFYGLAITSVFVVLPRMGSASYAVVLNFEPISLLFLGWLILGQGIAPVQIAGAFLVVGAIVWLGLARK
jgi:drug/metabolite transporter (DMT)-like permease